MSRILALRLSALGDVAMSVPVIYSFAENYPDSEIVVVSREKWGALFANMPSNVCFYGIDLQEYGGIRGLERLLENSAVKNLMLWLIFTTFSAQNILTCVFVWRECLWR